jgi:hypothetical protein
MKSTIYGYSARQSSLGKDTRGRALCDSPGRQLATQLPHGLRSDSGLELPRLLLSDPNLAQVEGFARPHREFFAKLRAVRSMGRGLVDNAIGRPRDKSREHDPAFGIGGWGLCKIDRVDACQGILVGEQGAVFPCLD